MSRSLALFGIGLIFGGGAGFLIAAANGVTLDGHDHADPAAHAGHAEQLMAHDHGTAIDLPATPQAPKLQIAIIQDPMSGWNLHVMTENFRFTPENASLTHVPGEGHAHVYVNGTKLARLYGNWMHIDSLPTGTNEISVSLNANDHNQLTVGGEPLSDSLTVTVD